MRKKLALLLCAVLMIGLLSACGGDKKEAAGSNSAARSREPLRIVTTIFPIYDWVREVLGDEADGAEITMLLDSGVDLHNYQPAAPDILKLAACDLFIYVGGGSDQWAEAALAEAVDPDMRIISLLEVLGDRVKEEETVEGMEREEEDDGDAGAEYDEHVWLSLRSAQIFCSEIADTLGQIDPEHAGIYAENADAYNAELSALDQAYAEAVENGSVHTLLFGDRFPFRYLADDYGLDYYAAFSGCSAETEASFETIIFLAGKTDELALGAILQIESSDGSISRTIRDNTQTKDQKILTLDSLQSTTSADAAEGVTYLSVMRSNLEVLRAALG